MFRPEHSKATVQEAETVFSPPDSFPTTGYVPHVPSMYHAGSAFWTVAWQDDVLRVFARRFSPTGILGAAVGTLLSAAMLAVLAWTVATQRIPQRQENTIIVGFSIAVLIGLIGILVGALGGNMRECRRPDVLVYDRATGWISLPRSGRRIRFDDAIRLELVRFWADFASRCRFDHLVLCSRGTDGAIQYDLMAASPSSVRRAGERLAAEMPLPLARINLGVVAPNRP
jgi:hypothetical protein